MLSLEIPFQFVKSEAKFQSGKMGEVVAFRLLSALGCLGVKTFCREQDNKSNAGYTAWLKPLRRLCGPGNRLANVLKK
jgi:hypothetical protein